MSPPRVHGRLDSLSSGPADAVRPGPFFVRVTPWLGAAWIPHKDKFHRVHYRASAELQEDGTVLTTHDFLDGIGKSLEMENNDELVHLLEGRRPHQPLLAGRPQPMH